MTLDLDAGTAFGIVAALVGAFWGLITLTVRQFERRQDERFATLTATLTSQKVELDEHMRKQDGVMLEIRRVEASSVTEIRRVETKLTECQLDALSRYQTKIEATGNHAEILSAIRSLGHRIDQLHGPGAGVTGKGQ